MSLKEKMPYSDLVSVKSHNFDDKGNESDLDYSRLMKTILDSGFRGVAAIEYEGSELDAVEGVRATQKLLERLNGGTVKSSMKNYENVNGEDLSGGVRSQVAFGVRR